VREDPGKTGPSGGRKRKKGVEEAGKHFLGGKTQGKKEKTAVGDQTKDATRQKKGKKAVSTTFWERGTADRGAHPGRAHG